MRRADREVKDFDQILDIMRGCDICELALNDVDGYPYVLPMNFALVMRDGKPALYFHGAREGKKLDLIARDGRCAFSMSRAHVLELAKVACATTWKYESVLGRGRISVVDDPRRALRRSRPSCATTIPSMRTSLTKGICGPWSSCAWTLNI